MTGRFSRRHKEKIFVTGGLHNFPPLHLPTQDLGQPGLPVQTEKPVQSTPPHIPVDQ